ncbi:MAG: ComEA family DNA-binding protein [Rhodothermales bacterium]
MKYWIYRLQERLYCTEQEAVLFSTGLAALAVTLLLRSASADPDWLVEWSYAEMDSLFEVLAARADSADNEVYWTPEANVVPADTIDFPIHLNTATAVHLDALPGVGPAIADRILAERRRVGGFTSVDDLLNVRGIGPKTMEKLRPLVTIAPDSTQTDPPSRPPTRLPPSSPPS